jgi:hypothetical protein
MIVNYRHKFIFLKTRKTAGTSIEIALSQFCDSNDIITPITDEDERTRQEMGFRGPQNYNLPLRSFGFSDWLTWLGQGRRKRYFNHASAPFIRDHVGEKIWNSYFKFCFERNPFDKAISRYYWSTKEPRPEISGYLQSARSDLLSNWNIYTINDRIAVDFVGRYESLGTYLKMLQHRLGLPKEIVLPRAKSRYRQNRAHYSQILNSEARARVEIVCAREMAALGYCWSESAE